MSGELEQKDPPPEPASSNIQIEKPKKKKATKKKKEKTTQQLTKQQVLESLSPELLLDQFLQNQLSAIPKFGKGKGAGDWGEGCLKFADAR